MFLNIFLGHFIPLLDHDSGETAGNERRKKDEEWKGHVNSVSFYTVSKIFDLVRKKLTYKLGLSEDYEILYDHFDWVRQSFANRLSHNYFMIN